MFWLLLALFLLATPFGLYSFSLFLFTLFIVFPIILYILYRSYALTPASPSLVTPFINLSIAHRGGKPEITHIVAGDNSTDFPENTMNAFQWAEKDGRADGFELDTWLSKDGVPVVHHDDSVQPKMDGKGRVNDLTLRELKSLRYKRKTPVNGKETYDKDIQMATLEEVIIWLEKTNMKLMIEVKENDNIKLMARNIVALYDKYPFLYDRAWVASFNPFFLYELRRCSARIVTSFLVTRTPTTGWINHAKNMKRSVNPLYEKNSLLRGVIDDGLWLLGTTPALIRMIGASFPGIHNITVSDHLLAKYRAADMPVSSWTVNNAHQQKYFISQGITAISDTKLGRKGI